MHLFVLLMKHIPPWKPELAFSDKIVSNLAADWWDYMLSALPQVNTTLSDISIHQLSNQAPYGW